MSTIFSKIINGEIPCCKIAETEKSFAFLDITPVKKGHTLVVPKVEVNKIFDVDEDYLQDMIVLSKKIGNAIEKVMPCNRVGVAVLGLEVPHAHIHLIPIDKEADLHFNNERLNLAQDEFESIAEKIKSNL